jgi:cell division protease FtsH
VQRILPKCDPVVKVSIISRGMALGYTMGLPTEDRYLQSKSEFQDKIAGMLGGTVAERLMFGDITTGASNDIEKATSLARRMVTEFGMSDKLGPLAFGKREEMIFLGREIGEQRNYSDEVAKQIDDEVRAIVDQAYERATEVLTMHKDRLTELAEALVAKETIEAEEFESMFADLPDPRKDPGGSPTPKLATPLAGLSKPETGKPTAAGDAPEPSPQPA